MPLTSIALLSLVALCAAMVGVVTGGNSLLTVPVMLSLGMPPKEAVATNMFAVTFLSLSGALRFAKSRKVRWDLTTPLVVVTLVTSYLGARLTSSLSDGVMRSVVTTSMAVMLVVMLARPRFGEAPASEVSSLSRGAGIFLAAVLGVYGGMYSGGYTTLLTFVVVGLLGASLLEAVGLTKIVNLASSAVASAEFARVGLIDLRVGVPMSLAMIAGAWLGASLALRNGQRFVRLVFLVSVAALATKLLYDQAMAWLR